MNPSDINKAVFSQATGRMSPRLANSLNGKIRTLLVKNVGAMTGKQVADALGATQVQANRALFYMSGCCDVDYVLKPSTNAREVRHFFVRH
jgi:hypothetical protein